MIRKLLSLLHNKILIVSILILIQLFVIFRYRLQAQRILCGDLFYSDRPKLLHEHLHHQ